MPGGGLLDVVHHDLADLVGLVVVHDEHDTLLEEGVGLLIALLLQGQKAALTGHLRQLHQLVDDAEGVVALGVHQGLEVLGDGLELAGREAGHDDGDPMTMNTLDASKKLIIWGGRRVILPSEPVPNIMPTIMTANETTRPIMYVRFIAIHIHFNPRGEISV